MLDGETELGRRRPLAMARPGTILTVGPFDTAVQPTSTLTGALICGDEGTAAVATTTVPVEVNASATPTIAVDRDPASRVTGSTRRGPC